MNQATGTTQPNRSPTGTTSTQTARAAKPPAARTLKSKCIQSTDDLMKEFSDRFTGIGKFPGEYKIRLCPDAQLVIHIPIKCPIALRSKVKEHLAKMETLGVITHVDQPTDWVSSITYVQKANSELHLCLYPCDLNRAIHHDHYKMPTVEEVAHEFANLHYFTKLKHTSWILVHSPWWRIKPLNYLQQPLWEVLFPASSLWYDLLTGHLPEEDGPVPQIVPWMYRNCWWHHHTCLHCGRTWCPSAESHAGSLQVWSCVQPTEMHVKAPAVNFFGWLYDANGVHPYLEKVYAVHALPAPTNVTELQEFLGMVTYLSPFIRGLSTLTAPLQELLKKDADFNWNTSYEAAFEWVKQAIISNTTLRYFNPSLPVTIQVNASQIGLGAALLQNNKPIAFASKALTDAECRYANIERC